ncbi:unnamed protein product [Adineta steineri]|uniref:Uncharacterized protein n=1 Tax=Adineta steineri TaxID=433720 RepID=A0A819C1M9_9BILA|nr:unnamed protein product [Adineta steineri]
MAIFSIGTVIVLTVVSLVTAKAPRTDVTVSGISSGGAMATQLHLAFSKDISGCGILAGPPFYCAGSGFTTALCMSGPAAYVSVSTLQLKINSYALTGSIDSPTNIASDSVYVFSGKYDTVAYPGVVKLNEDLYKRFGANVKTNFDMAAHHGFPTNNFGAKCAVLNKDNFINDCQFNMAYDMLNHLYGGNLIEPKLDSKTSINGQMLTFDQDGFMNPPSSLKTAQNSSSAMLQWIQESMALYNPENWNQSISGFFKSAMPKIAVSLKDKTKPRSSSAGFDEQGFVYFPSACTNGQKCSIHVALHGCQQGKSYVGDTFATKAGYIEVAELNNIILIFPQILRSYFFPTNPMGCWDWWGYSSLYYATQTGPQMSGVKKMIDTVRMINTAFRTANK